MFKQLKILAAIVAFGMTSLSVHADPNDCEEKKERLEKQYQQNSPELVSEIKVVLKSEETSGETVGTCDSGVMKLVLFQRDAT